jgi:hypothetical protein
MNPRKIILRYVGWCPSTGSAARFTPNNVDTTKRLIKVFTPIMIASLFVASQILLRKPTYPPSWIIAERIAEPEYPEEYVSIEESELSNHPFLTEAIEEADRAPQPSIQVTPSGTWISGLSLRLASKMTNEEGRELLDFLGGEYKKEVEAYTFKIRLDGDYYHIFIEFGEGTPGRI